MVPYTPDELPLAQLDYARLFSLVGRANSTLARYDGLLTGIVNASVMLSPLTNEEAVLSSRIEGTQATVDEVLQHEAGLTKVGEVYKDIQEIINYRNALRQGKEHLIDRPLTLSFIASLHSILMNSTRGHDKRPGEFRNNQNWIGPAGCDLEDATFVPPNPLQLFDWLEKWKSYLDLDDVDVVVQTAIMHAQFELLHPFNDGNGRIGRILIPLFLYRKSALSEPMFYLSSYLERNRDEYYRRLQHISENGDWNGWIEFFLKAVIEQSESNSARVKAIMALYEEMKIEIRDITHSQFSIQVLDAIFNRPIFKTTDFISATGIHKQTASGLLRQLRDAKILETVFEGSGRRPTILCFPRLLKIAEGRES